MKNVIVPCINRSFNLWYLYIKLFEQLFIAVEPISDEQMNTRRNVQVVSYQIYFSFTFKRNNKYTSLKMVKAHFFQPAAEIISFGFFLLWELQAASCRIVKSSSRVATAQA